MITSAIVNYFLEWGYRDLVFTPCVRVHRYLNLTGTVTTEVYCYLVTGKHVNGGSDLDYLLYPGKFPDLEIPF